MSVLDSIRAAAGKVPWVVGVYLVLFGMLLLLAAYSAHLGVRLQEEKIGYSPDFLPTQLLGISREGIKLVLVALLGALSATGTS